MKFLPKCMLILSVLSLTAVAAMAQDDRTKFEFYGGYSYLSSETGLDGIDPGFNNRIGAHGFEAAATGNVHRYVGIKGDISYHSHSKDLFVDSDNFVHAQLQTTQFVGGLQFKDNQLGGGPFRPFAHVMAGIAHQNVSGSGIVTPPGPIVFDQSTNNFAMVFGGGVDLRANDRISIRLIQVDYNPVFFGGGDFGTFTVDSSTQHTLRFGVGLVIH